MLQIDSCVCIVAGTENEAISEIKLGFGQWYRTTLAFGCAIKKKFEI